MQCFAWEIEGETGGAEVNLAKLFETQKVLRDRIAYNESDRFDKLILALLVEIGECANEWRGFKFWSKRQFPTNEEVHSVDNQGNVYYRNTLLEEYVDGLHFVLEVGLEIADEIQFDVSDYFTDIKNEINGNQQKTKNVVEQFNYIFYLTTTAGYDFCFEYLFAAYFHLGEMLGFSWDQIEQAYYSKNQINHERQNNGY